MRERNDGDAVVFKVITGIPDEAGPFASHGQALRLVLLQAPTPINGPPASSSTPRRSSLAAAASTTPERRPPGSAGSPDSAIPAQQPSAMRRLRPEAQLRVRPRRAGVGSSERARLLPAAKFLKYPRARSKGRVKPVKLDGRGACTERRRHARRPYCAQSSGAADTAASTS